ncbi:hypothetical protein BCR44DRAFT_265797 [Catenaria anguillulae PL171]|uniref:Uncharacterized protein n=1 Tax=Catenaria anguillulae PL171 TaxID=765915 RepID=A0A1Y2H986_9FUNG|nr:hypothetical protein BCR44DRAFT_265797 [Catenaria anguillulae PL171]
MNVSEPKLMYAAPHRDAVMDAPGWLLLQLHLILDGDRMHEVIDWTSFGTKDSPCTSIVVASISFNAMLTFVRQVHVFSSHKAQKAQKASTIDSGIEAVTQGIIDQGVPIVLPSAIGRDGESNRGASQEQDAGDDIDDDSDSRKRTYRNPIDPATITSGYQQVYQKVDFFCPKVGHHGRWVDEIAFALGWSNSVMETIYGHNAILYRVLRGAAGITPHEAYPCEASPSCRLGQAATGFAKSWRSFAFPMGQRATAPCQRGSKSCRCRGQEARARVYWADSIFQVPHPWTRV